MSPALRAAAIILAAAMMVGVGWAAEKIYEKLTFTQAMLILEKHPRQEWTLPSGEELTTVGTTVTDVDPNDPAAIESAHRQTGQMKEAIIQKKYELLRTFTNEFTGETEYVYKFTLPGGTHNMNFLVPLDNISCWDDYQRKAHEHRRHYQEQVNKAFAGGKYRLIDEDVILMHICLE
jgi:hypothetical protein